MVATKLVTGDELLAMGADAPYELIEGELREVSPTSARPTTVTSIASAYITMHVLHLRLGYVSSSDGGYFMTHDPDSILAPDIGFIGKERIPAGFDFEHFFPVPPDLAVEVVSPSNTRPEILRKVALYQEAGVPLVWVVFLRQRAVEVHPLGEPVTTLHEGDDLDGGEVLPGFRLPVARIFEDPLAD